MKYWTDEIKKWVQIKNEEDVVTTKKNLAKHSTFDN